MDENEKGPLLAERRAFMRLPLEQRRRLLAEVADGLANYYLRNSEWQELETRRARRV